ncbi:MAG: sodium-translocating pyrophosphatase [Erysipelotrichaceae bacterium]|nr:sodium-translocating pyrophosphatase [Erysipelotrichaceae bacterium]
MSNLWLFIILGVCLLALLFVVYNYIVIKRMPEGTDRMVKMAGIIRDGSNVFIKKEFTTIAIVIASLAVLFTLFIEKFSGITYILGATMSSIVCILGMKSATYANVRTANKAKESLNVGETVKVALKGGSISGLSVQALGLLGLLLIVLISGVGPQQDTIIAGLLKLDGFEGNGLIPIKALLTNTAVMRITTYSLGCSTVAMFNRVAGGNYTKAADISADILGKIRNDLPEDDSRVPNVIADFIGDNVNDIAGNCSDLLESFVATISASIVLAIAFLGNTGLANITKELFTATYMYPLIVAGGGLLSCVIGLFIVQVRKMGDNPSKELNLATYISAGLTLVVVGVLSYVAFGNAGDALKEVLGFKAGWATPWICCVLGLISGVAIGMITEYYTSADFKPTKTVAEYAVEGEAFVVTKGDAVGSKSVMLPVAIIGVALVIAASIGGTYGIAISALGMLSFVGTTVSIDAFGPIADNAGGLAESCHLDPEVRKITDKLDSVGNTTAAVGKGFAIGSAAFATVSLICAYVSNLNVVPRIDSFMVIAGCIIGGALIEFFCALLTDNTIASAKELADVGDRQLSDPAILAGEKDPDYNELVALATKTALKRMLVPSVIALAVPFVCGAILGPEFVIGILLGATVVAIPRAIFMGNSGGSFDNAKKYIESGAIEGHGKGSAAHKAAVTGDTIGDTRKDVVGVALDIFIKMMSTVATTLFVVITALYSLIQTLFK